MPSTKLAPYPHQRSPGAQDDWSGSPANPSATSSAIDREHLLDRLQRLRGILPVFAQELASARRQAAALRVENRGLLEELRRLRAQHDAQSRRA
jgi:hypothetical protein